MNSQYSTFSTIIVWFLLLVGSALARDITEAEARRLVIVSLSEKVSTLPHFGLDTYKDQGAEGFYLFEATAEHPNGGSPVIGQFAVNRATGDVWRLGICERVRSGALAREQLAIRKKIRISQNEFQKLTAKAPCQP